MTNKTEEILKEWESEAKQINAILGQTGTEIYLRDRLAECDTRILKLIRLVRVQREALEFYGSEESFIIPAGKGWAPDWLEAKCPLQEDGGKRAREALALSMEDLE